MRWSRTAAIAPVVLLAGVGGWLALRKQPDVEPPQVAPDVEVVPIGDSAAEARALATEPEALEPPWVPSGKACHGAVAHGATFGQVTDARLASIIVDGFDPKTERFPILKAVHAASGDAEITMLPEWGTYVVRDCRGDRAEYDHPLTEAERRRPGDLSTADPDVDASAGASVDASAGASAGARVSVWRYDARGSRMAVYLSVAVQAGYSFQCRGFQAVVRLDDDELVVEGVGAAELYECGQKGNELHLAPIGDGVALLLPISTGTGESGDASGEWEVYLPKRGALRRIGTLPRFRGAGNGTISTGGWFGNMEATLLDAGTFEVAEVWRFEHWQTGNSTPGPTRRVSRTYELRDGGGLTRSPKGDPTPDADVP